MISHRFIKYVPEISKFQEQYSTTSFISKMSFFCSQEGVKYGPRGGGQASSTSPLCITMQKKGKGGGAGDQIASKNVLVIPRFVMT